MSSKHRQQKKATTDHQPAEYHFTLDDQDTHGLLHLELASATELPKLKNPHNLVDGWDNDPFIIVTFGDEKYKTQVVKHNLNPVWNETVTFQILKSQLADPDTHFHFSVLDYDDHKMADKVGNLDFKLSDALESEFKPIAETGLYPEVTAAASKEFNLPLRPARDAKVNPKQPPVVHVRAKFQPHEATRQYFWRQQFKAADPNNTNKVTRAELTNLVSTHNLKLDAADIDKFFTQQGAVGATDGLAIDEILAYLENTVAGKNIPYPKPPVKEPELPKEPEPTKPGPTDTEPPKQTHKYRIVVQLETTSEGFTHTIDLPLSQWIDGNWTDQIAPAAVAAAAVHKA